MSEVWQDSALWTFNPQKGCFLTERFKGKLFDSYFGKSSHPTQNHVLKLFLRVNLTQVNNKTTALDSHRKRFPIKNWEQDEWFDFTSSFERQSGLWNHRFWLIPPKYFTLLDVKNGGRTVRPNIQCQLVTEITNSKSNAHRTMKVVNLDVDALEKQKGIKNPNAGTFFSNDKKLDSLDVKPGNTSYKDDRGVEHKIKNFYVIAHEIGHAIGLEHIGVLKARPQCTFAISLKEHGIKNVSSHLKRGANSLACYGEFDSLGLAENIMGLGTKFEEVNAQPWLDRIAMHTNTKASDWKVSLAPVSPKAVF